MEYCADGHPPSDGQYVCAHGHPVIRTMAEDVQTAETKSLPPEEVSYAEPLWKERVHVEAEHTNEYKGDHMGDNISTPTIQGFGGLGGWNHWKDRDGLEGKDAVLIHALHDDDGKRDLLARILESKFDMAKCFDDKLDRVRDRFEDKFDKLDCKFERIEDRVQEFERRRIDRVVKEQDDTIQELKLKLYLCEHPPVPAPVPAP